MIGILVLWSMVVLACILILLVSSIFIQPIAWYWILSPIWITWGITTIAFVICAPIAVYLNDKTWKGRG